MGPTVNSNLTGPGSGAAPTTPPDQTNWLERLLPSAGGVLGGLGAAALAPETGGLSLLLPILGGALGSGAGKAAENAMTGQDPLSGVPGAVAEGGIGQGIGAAVGGLAGMGTEALAGRAAEQGVQEEFGGLSNALRSKLNFNSTKDTFGNYGIPFNVDTIGKVAPQITGGEDAVLSNAVRNAMKSAGPVDLSEVGPLINRTAASPELAALGPSVGRQFEDTLIPEIDRLFPSSHVFEGDAPGVFSLQQNLEKMAYNPKTPPALSDAYRTIADHLDDKLSGAGANDIVAAGVINPADYAKLSAISPQLAQDALKASTVGELRSLQAPFVKANQIANAAQQVAEGQMTPQIPSLQKKIGSVLEFGGPAAAMVTGNPLLGLAGGAGLMLKNPALLSKAAGVLGGIPEELLGGAASAGGQLVAHAPDFTPGTNGAINPGGSNVNPYLTASPNEPSTGGFDPNRLPEMAMAAATYAPQFLPELAQAQQMMAPVQASQRALTALRSLEMLYNQAGGGQGRLGGLLAQLGGAVTGGPASKYAGESAQIAQQISQSTGIPAAAILASLPTLQQTPGAAQSSFGNLQAQLSSLPNPSTFATPAPAAPPANSGILSALMTAMPALGF